jgi:hypothetical protein
MTMTDPAPPPAPVPDDGPQTIPTPFVMFEELHGAIIYITPDAVMAIRDEDGLRTVYFGANNDYFATRLTPQDILRKLYTEGVEI